MKYKAVVFDMDGTLLDTEKLNVRFWMEAGRTFGYNVTEEDVLFIRSLDGRFVRKYLCERFPGFDFDRVREERRRLMDIYVNANGVELKPGVREILEYLRSNGVKTAVATASRQDHVTKYLSMTGIDGLFNEIVCTSSVKNGKPAPDVYLYACEKIGELPQDCAAVEDAPNGVRSAYDAGCDVIFIPDLTGPDQEMCSKATVYNDLFAFLNELI